MTYDIAAIRSRFPALQAGTAHFDGPGGTQTPEPVIRAIVDALSNPLSNRGHGVPGERNAESIVVETRRAMADLLAAGPSGIVFGRSATQLAYDFSRTLAKTWQPGDEVVVTRLDHDANIRPWVQAAERAGATVRWAEFDPATGELTTDDIRAVLSERTRLVAVTAASNLIGTRPAITEIAGLAREVGALTYVDGVHYAAHTLVDLETLGADFSSAPRTSSSARTMESSPPGPSCWTPCGRTSSFPPPTWSPSASNWARCPTSSSRAPGRPSTSSPVSTRAPRERDGSA